MIEIKSIKVLRFSVYTTLFSLLIHIWGALYTAIIFPYLAGASPFSLEQILSTFGNYLAIGFVFGFFALGIFGGILYNIVASVFGGIKFRNE